MREIPEGFKLLDLQQEDFCDHIVNCINQDLDIEGIGIFKL